VEKQDEIPAFLLSIKDSMAAASKTPQKHSFRGYAQTRRRDKLSVGETSHKIPDTPVSVHGTGVVRDGEKIGQQSFKYSQRS